MADIDGDGCGEVVEVTGGVVSIGGRRWQVAEADDVVVVGDWDCDGSATPTIVRPTTGGVWVFARWAEADEDVTAEEAGNVPGAVSASPVPAGGGSGTGQGCDDLEVTDTAGKKTRLRLGS